MTPYQYCYQNPINLVDPTGMSAEGGDGTDDWIKDKETGKIHYEEGVTKDNVPEGYEYYSNGSDKNSRYIGAENNKTVQLSVGSSDWNYVEDNAETASIGQVGSVSTSYGLKVPWISDISYSENITVVDNSRLLNNNSNFSTDALTGIQTLSNGFSFNSDLVNSSVSLDDFYQPISSIGLNCFDYGSIEYSSGAQVGVIINTNFDKDHQSQTISVRISPVAVAAVAAAIYFAPVEAGAAALAF